MRSTRTDSGRTDRDARQKEGWRVGELCSISHTTVQSGLHVTFVLSDTISLRSNIHCKRGLPQAYIDAFNVYLFHFIGFYQKADNMPSCHVISRHVPHRKHKIVSNLAVTCPPRGGCYLNPLYAPVLWSLPSRWQRVRKVIYIANRIPNIMTCNTKYGRR